MIVLNVGGQKFETSVETLTMRYGFFKNLIESFHGSEREFFIDRDGTYFRHILNYLRGSHYLPPNSAILKQLRIEADFYSLNEMISLIDWELKKGVRTIEEELNCISSRIG